MHDLPSVQRVILTGFMGAGKTTVGRALAAQMNWAFHDLDREVERHTGQSVPAIFAEHGEARFRELEAEVLATLLPGTQVVLALGGGAPESPATASQLRSAPNTLIVYLAAPFQTLAGRCLSERRLKDTVLRPLFLDPAEAETRLARREPLYQELAQLTVWTDGISVRDITASVLAAVFAPEPLPRTGI